MAAVTIIDENNNPLRNAILYGIDTRSTSQVAVLNSIIGEEKLKRICGGLCNNESFGPKIKWIKDNQPELFAKTKHITFASGFITARLTGHFAVDKHSVQAARPMIDARGYSWNEELCSYICPVEMLPRICDTTDIIGTVTPEAAGQTGLAVGTPVICGTTDAAAEAVSVGVTEPGDTMLMYGSTAFMLHVSGEPLKNELLWKAPYVIKGCYDNCAGMGTTGSLTTWIRNVMARDLVQLEKEGGKNAFDALFGEAAAISPGSDGLLVLPDFLGRRAPVEDPLARGVFFGLRLDHTRGHLVHAAFEGIGFGISQLFDLLPEQVKRTEVCAAGGGVKTLLWLQIVSDICGIRQMVPQVKIGASYGDALLAGLGVGIVESPSAIKKMINVESVVEPDSRNKCIYRKYKELYRELYAKTEDIMHKI
jgi:xylulokinase